MLAVSNEATIRPNRKLTKLHYQKYSIKGNALSLNKHRIPNSLTLYKFLHKIVLPYFSYFAKTIKIFSWVFIYLYIYIYESTKFPNIWVPPSNYWHHKSEKKHVPYSGPTNISCYCTKFSCHSGLVHGICESLS